MKKITILLFAFLISCGSLTPTAILPENLKQEKVIEIKNQTKDKLFITANDWMVSTFGNAESVIQFTDKEEGTVIGKYHLSGKIISTSYGTTDGRLFAKITVQVKENRARIIIIPTSIAYVYNDSQKINTQKLITDLIVNFENTIKSKQTTDW